MEATSRDGSTRELNGNIAVTQSEFLEKVLRALQPRMTQSGYLSVVLSYVQSLLHLNVPISAELFSLWVGSNRQSEPSSAAHSRLGGLQNHVPALLSAQYRHSEARRGQREAAAAAGRRDLDAGGAEHAARSQRLRNAAELLQQQAGRWGEREE